MSFLAKLFPVVQIGRPEVQLTRSLVSQTIGDLDALYNTNFFQRNSNSIFSFYSPRYNTGLQNTRFNGDFFIGTEF